MTSRKYAMGAIAASALLSSPAAADLLANGGFETNLNNDTTYNMNNADFTASMANTTAFGSGNEVDIISSENSEFGLPAIEGDWSIALHSNIFTDADDAISMGLIPTARAGELFRVELSAQMATEFDPGPGSLEIGISSTANSFGALVHSFNLTSSDTWESLSADFFSTTGFQYLTLRSNRNGGDGVWIHVDAVSLTSINIPAPTTLALLSLAALSTNRRKRCN